MMRALLLFSILVTAGAALGALVAGCGDDPGYSGLPYAYPIDATPDGVIEAEGDASVDRH